MRKLILLGLMAATAMSGAAANAQSHGEIRRDRQELRQDRRELRQDRRELRRDIRDHRVAYSAPYGGWRYRPVTIGYQLRPGYWGSRYVVTNYDRYRLSVPRANQRWIRYGDDLVLVNVRNGRVLQVYRGRY